MFLNRETRDGLSAAEKSYLNESFQYTGGGLLFTALAARSLFRSGAAVRIMSANPCESSNVRVGCIPTVIDVPSGVVLGVSLVGSIGTMWGAMSTSPERPLLKHALWLVRILQLVARFQTSKTHHPHLGFQRIPSRHPQSAVLLVSRVVGASRAVHVRCCRFPVLCGGNSQERQVFVSRRTPPRRCHRRGVELSRPDGTPSGYAWPRDL
jgi:hypothetical protein